MFVNTCLLVQLARTEEFLENGLSQYEKAAILLPGGLLGACDQSASQHALTVCYRFTRRLSRDPQTSLVDQVNFQYPRSFFGILAECLMILPLLCNC